MREKRRDGREQNRNRVSKFSRFHLLCRLGGAKHDDVRFFWGFVHGDADERQSVAIRMRLISGPNVNAQLN
jgi:hypothetical protein